MPKLISEDTRAIIEQAIYLQQQIVPRSQAMDEAVDIFESVVAVEETITAIRETIAGVTTNKRSN